MCGRGFECLARYARSCRSADKRLHKKSVSTKRKNNGLPVNSSYERGAYLLHAIADGLRTCKQDVGWESALDVNFELGIELELGTYGELVLEVSAAGPAKRARKTHTERERSHNEIVELVVELYAGVYSLGGVEVTLNRHSNAAADHAVPVAPVDRGEERIMVSRATLKPCILCACV